VQEVANVLEALNGLVHREMIDGSLSSLCPKRVKEFNAIVLKGLQLEEGVTPGEIRTYGVGVGRYRGAPAEDCDYLLHQLCGWLNGREFDSSKNERELGVPIALLKAVLAHLYLAWIHPFGDGNGRTARLLEVQLLAMAGVPDVACHLLSNHYNDTRAEYYRQLERASASGDDALPFIEYAIRGFVDGLTEHISTVRTAQWDVSWINFVHEQFKGRKTRSSNRMKELVLELSKKYEPVARRELLALSPQLAVAYTDRDKTLSRDLNGLERMNLIRRVQDRYEPCRETILAFLPARHERPDIAAAASSLPADAASPTTGA
jgi:Fic family protein